MNKLMSEIRKIGKEMYGKIQEHFLFFMVSLTFSILLYFLLISNQLVNSDDGLWEYNYYKAGRWSLSIGRWFWLYIDRLRFGISTEPITSIMTLTFFSAGFIFILDLFEFGKQKLGYLVSLLFLSSTAVCISLSYRFMSPTFGLAFFLSVIAPWIMVKWKNKILSVLIGGVSIALSMGLYQSYLGCTCMILIGYFLYILQNKDVDIKNICIDFMKAFFSVVVGGGVYVGVLNIHLKFFHVSMSDYNGGNTYSLWNTLKNLLNSIEHTYRVFIRYFIENYYKTNVLQECKIYIISFILIIILLTVGFISIIKVNKIKAILYILFVAAIPVASNAILLIATSAWTSLQMTAPMALCIPILLCVCAKNILLQKKLIKRLIIFVFILLLYGNIYQVQIDQNAMLEGKNATVTIANNIIHDLSTRGCLNADLKYCVVGTPVNNKLFYTSNIYGEANGYARFGSWIQDNNCNRRSWQSVFSNLCGMDLQICTGEEYGMVLDNEFVKNMEVYPNEGYIFCVDNIVVIKVAE